MFRSAFFLCLIVFGGRLLAFNDPETARKLSFQESVRLVVSKNEDYLIEKKNLENKDFALKQKWAAFLPTLSANLKYSQAFPNNGVYVSTQGYGQGLNSDWNLFNGFQDVKGYRSGRLDYALEQNKLKKTYATTVYNLKVAFENLRAQQDLIDISQGVLKLRKDNERLVLLRFQSGRENKGSYLDAQTSSAQAELDLYKAKVDRRNQARALATLLDEDANQDIVVTDDIPPMRLQAAMTSNMEKDHPDYKEVIFNREKANIDDDVSKLKFLPTLALDTYIGSGSDTLPVQGHTENNNWGVTLTLTLPLFNGGSDYLGVLAARNSLEISEIKLRKSVVDIRNAIQNSFDGLEISRRSFDIAVKKLESMKIREKLARERYNIGVMSFEDWNTIVNDLIESQKSLNESKKGRITAEAAWISALGRGDIE